MSVSVMSFAVLALLLAASVADSANSPAVAPRSGLGIEASPNQIFVGFTDQLTVNCTFTHEVNSNFSTVVSLVLSKTASPTDSAYSEVASITAFSNDKVHEKDTMGAHVTGHHKADAYSFIALEWTYPTSQVVGKYRCEANGLDEEGHTLTAVADTVVEKKEAQIDMILNEMKEMKTKMTEMDTKFNDLRTRVDNSKAAFTEATTSYGNSHYILFKPIFRSVAEGNRLCRLYGGYLAEINDRQEFDYLADYLSNTTSTAYNVMLGATDEGHEGTWKFLTSGGNMSTLWWLPNEPNGGTKENCLILSKTSKLMYDYACFTLTVGAQFLCEISV